MTSLVAGYMWLFIHRPFEVWPWISAYHVERVYHALRAHVAFRGPFQRPVRVHGRLLSGRALASRLGANARQRAFGDYSLYAQARHFETLCRELLEGKNGRTVNGNGIMAKLDESRQSG